MTPTRTPDAGIPTTYRGVCFRSRAEARWASLFDQARWPWSYEPVDGPAGYIPDFLVRGPLPVFLEVKGGATTVNAIRAEATALRPRATGLPHPVVVVGADLGTMPTVGIDTGSAALVALVQCAECHRLALSAGDAPLAPCGHVAGFALVDRGHLAAAWAHACNATQWRPR